MDEQQTAFEFQTLTQILLTTWDTVISFAYGFVTPGWRQNQLLIILALIALAWLLKYIADPRIEAYARSREGWPKWRFRILVQIRRRLILIFFAITAWAVYIYMQQVTWPSRSYMIGLGATLATAWLVIAFAARLVKNPLLRRLAKWAVWIYATLYYLNLLEPTAEFLDSLALTVGEVRVSVLMVITGALILGVVLMIARLVSQASATRIRSNDDLSPSMQVLAVKAIQVVVYGLAFIIGVEAIGFDLTGLAVLSGRSGRTRLLRRR